MSGKVRLGDIRLQELEAENQRLRETLEATRRRIPRCSGRTESGYRCARGAGHSGPHSHPREALAGDAE
jgi:hypothetical protein